MAEDQNEDVIILNQKLETKEREIQRLKEEKNLLEENLDQQEEATKEVRRALQKQIEEYENEIDGKDELIDSLTSEVASLKNNNKIQDVDGATEQNIETLKEQLNSKDATLTEMKEKLNKGGMTINNLHMEIRELKEDLSSAKDSMTTQSEKMKEMRNENTQLKSTVKELQTQLESPGKEPVEEPEGQKNIVQLEILKKEMERKNEELMSTQIQLEKCQKQLNSKSAVSTENTNDSKGAADSALQEALEQEKLKTRDLQMKLEKSQSDLQKAVVGIAVLVMAFLVAKFLF